jgi:WD40 repeat protein
LAELLLANKADTNAKDDSGHTPLHYAFGSVEVVELLLQSGAEVNPKNNRGRTPLRMAEMRRQKDVVKLLLARGAKAKVVSPQPKLLRPALVLTGHSGMVNCVDVGHADGFRAVSGGEDGTIRLWNIYDGECSGVIKVGVPVKRICYCDDDITIIALCGDGVIRYYEPSGLLIAHVDGIADLRDGASDGLEPEITAFARYPGTKNVAYCARQLYDSLRVSRGGQSWSTRWNTGSIVTIKSLAINSDQGWIAAGGWRELVVWSTGRGNSADTSAPQKLMYVDGVLHEWVDPDPQYETSYGGEILALGTSWPGIVAGDNEGFITVWDFGDDGYKVRQTGEDLDEDSVNEEEFSSTNTLRLVRELDGHDSCVSCLASNDNVVLTGSYDNTLKLWDLTKGKCLSVMECPGTFGKTHPFDVSLCSGSRKRAVSAHDGVICVWDTSSAY